MATTTKKMLIDQKYLAPVAEFTEFSEVGYRYKFDSSDSYKQGRNVVKFIWNFGDDSEVVQSNTSEVFHTFNREGFFNVNLTVLDDRGATSTITKNVYIYYADVPNPGPANDDTIEGIDSNNNGIRDDIERWIQYEAKDKVEVKTWLNKLAQKYQLQIVNVSDQGKIREYETDKNNLKACLMGSINNDEEADHLLNVLKYLYISTELRSSTNSKIEQNLIGSSEETIPTEQVERLKLCPSTP